MTLKRVIFVGGGSGGHVIPALTLINYFQKRNIRCSYIGSISGIERSLVPSKVDRYWPIQTGKLRRYFSWQNFSDFLRVIFGIVQTLFILRHYKRNEVVVFSTGGFVSVPVSIASFLLRFKFVVHEQTTRAGLANKIASKLAAKVFLSFHSSLDDFPEHKSIVTGYPVREACLSSELLFDKYKGVNLKTEKIIFVTGGGNGAHILNEIVKRNLAEWTKEYIVIHQVGKAEFVSYQSLKNSRYIPVAFIGDEMIDLMKASEIVISRAGAGTVCELISLGKPSILVPLKIAQRNEQYHNAIEAKKMVGSIVITEDEFNDSSVNRSFKLLSSEIVESNLDDAAKRIFESLMN